MAGFATNPDRFAEYGLTQDRFNTAYEIAKLRFKAAGSKKKKVSDKDVLDYLGLDKDATIVSKIKAGYPAATVTKKLIEFIAEFAPCELSDRTNEMVRQWKKKTK